jgi:hypothetical protein
MEVDAISAPPASEVKAEEGSQKGEKGTYKSFKYVLTFTRVLNVVSFFQTPIFEIAIYLSLSNYITRVLIRN